MPVTHAKYATSRATVWGSISYIDYEAIIAGEKRDLDALPDTLLRFGATLYFLEDRLTATLAVHWWSDLERLDGETNTLESEIDNSYTVNVFASYKLKERLGTFLKVKNILGADYASKGIKGPTPQEKLKVIVGIDLSL